MNPQEQERFEFLRKGQCVPVPFVQDYYGLPWPFPDDLRPVYEAWRNQIRKQATCGSGGVSRFDLEAFMQQSSVVSKKWLGASLGMNVASLDQLLNRLKELGMQPRRYVVYDDLIAESLAEDLALNLPGLKFRTFSDHNSFCVRLHAELESVLRIKVEPLFCATSVRMQDEPRQFAINFDCITLEPVSGKHQMWLDFKKPLTLGPDRCSKLIYAENRDALQDYCAGTQEPDDLEEYLQFLTGQQSG